MKARISIVVATLIAFIVGASVFLYSQTQMTTLFSVQVPFDFRVGSSHLSAGHYRVLHVGSHLILLQRDDGKAQGLIPVMVSDRPSGESASKLVFNRYGDQYFLSQVWTAEDGQRHDCFPSQSEEIVLANQQRSGEVTVAAKR